MKKKILAFVTDGEKFLALRNNPVPKLHGGDYWYTVTGDVKPKEKLSDAVVREILEETGLKSDKIHYLNWGSIYVWNSSTFVELNHISFVKREEITLNHEHIEYKWLDLEEYISQIRWYDHEDNPKPLDKILSSALSNSIYLKEEVIVDYRIKGEPLSSAKF